MFYFDLTLSSNYSLICC